ncbi:hypothetical protein E2C01_080782 [Portunus trituberculatus]|uniref:Uncharacterized protein n=1 Tax=Portunus trituberculatus TaxID=210409 RepID=A0A5B7J0I3_PORTR|nr:hypothetical protein [Portunus trituberculatus]
MSTISPRSLRIPVPLDLLPRLLQEP